MHLRVPALPTRLIVKKKIFCNVTLLKNFSLSKSAGFTSVEKVFLRKFFVFYYSYVSLPIGGQKSCRLLVSVCPSTKELSNFSPLLGFPSSSGAPCQIPPVAPGVIIPSRSSGSLGPLQPLARLAPRPVGEASVASRGEQKNPTGVPDTVPMIHFLSWVPTSVPQTY